MDRGPIEALLRVTRVLENTMGTLDVDHPDHEPLQVDLNVFPISITFEQAHAMLIWKI